MTNEMKRTTIFLGAADLAAIKDIQERFGISTDSSAIRTALRYFTGYLVHHETRVERMEMKIGQLEKAAGRAEAILAQVDNPIAMLENPLETKQG